MIPTVPCKNCKIRHFGCHSDCDGYKQYRKLLEEHNQAEEKRKYDEDFYFREKERLQ